MTDPDSSVIVATDLGSATDVALRAGHAQAVARGRRLIVCHVTESAMHDEELERATRMLEDRVTAVTHRQHADFDTVVVTGEPTTEIAGLARTRHAELLVIGESDTATGSRRVLGTVAERIVHDAPCSVLVARPEHGLRVLVATDLSEPSFPAIAAAGHEAARRNVPLTAIHCVHSASDPTDADLADTRQKLDAALQRFGLRAELAVLVGSAAETILHACDGVGADLVVIGTHGRGWLQRVLLGSTAEAVVRHAPCSVLVVRT